MRISRRDLAVLAAGLLPCVSLADSLDPKRREFVEMMASKHGFDPATISRLLGEAKVDKRVLELLEPPQTPGKRVHWDEYRARHVNVRVITGGALFMAKEADALELAEKEYGVPASIIAAILGVETRYGTNTGSFNTLRTLATLGFDYPPRADFFRRELERLFLYAREAKVDVSKIEGSYAGAVGIPQFLPTSLQNWAVDFDNDGVADLFNPVDAIGSVANFLVDHGWQRDVQVTYPVIVSADARPQKLLSAGIKPSLSAQDFADAGMPISFVDQTPYAGEFALVDLVNENSVEYRAGTGNYYALTRYNRSNKYAISVRDLADQIK